MSVYYTLATKIDLKFGVANVSHESFKDVGHRQHVEDSQSNEQKPLKCCKMDLISIAMLWIILLPLMGL